MFPDWLFRLAASDEDSQILSIWDRQASVTSALQNFNATLEAVPNDKVVILTNIHMDGIPDAGDQLVALTCQKIPSGGGSNFLIYAGPGDQGSFINNIAVWARWQGYYLLAPGETLEAIGSFNAVPAATHLIRIFAQGIILPRGNIVQG